MKRDVDYTWRLAELMAAHGMHNSTDLIPRLAERGIYTQIVTSAVRPIPLEWASIPRLQIVVSIDGLQPEHDARRTPATLPNAVSSDLRRRGPIPAIQSSSDRRSRFLRDSR